MTASVAPTERPAFRLTPSTIGLLTLAALAWAGVIAYVRDLGNGRGSMGMSLREFMPMWTVMMAAMMLPAVAPVSSLYARTITRQRSRRLALFVAGYLISWGLAGLPVYGLLRLVDHIAGDSDTAMRNIAVAALVAAGLYQLTPLKARCLRHCRSPLAQLLRYGNVKGPLRDLQVALHHGGYCLGCCWALMVLFIGFGVMNVWIMLGLAAIVAGEKVLRRGQVVGRLAGVAFLVLVLVLLTSPRAVDTLLPARGTMPGGTMTEMGS